MVSEVSDLSVLVVEHQTNMRTQMRGMLADCGIGKVHIAHTAGAAVRKLHDNLYDLILCEYNLGEGQDGQHFLEDIRSHHLVPLSTIFIMVTGESSYERVVSAAELAPNDYILKPFALDRLQERLERALTKRAAFLPAWTFIESGQALEAIEACIEGEKAHPQFAIDFLRLRAELLTTTGRPEEAQALYRQVLERRAVPWAKLGVAKTLYMTKRFDEAEQTLLGLLGENEAYLDAWDWLARTREVVGELKSARLALEKAASISPHVLKRLRKIGEVALQLGDLDAAEKTLAEVVRKSKYSDFRDPEDHVRLVKAQLGAGAQDRAAATLRDLDRSMQGQPKTELCSALGSALLHTQSGDSLKATEEASRATTLLDSHQAFSLSIKQDLARICLEHNLEDKAAEVVMDILRHATSDTEIDGVKGMLTELGRPQMGEALAQRMRSDVREMMAEGAQLAQRGDYEAAVKHMTAAAQRMPGNTLVLYNASLSLLKYIEHCGWDDRYANHARGLIERLSRQDPGNTRLSALHAYFEGLQKRYGKRPG
ncbi:tetratricopeptide repeat protein [Niveibacterium sp. SC-1]|uniref:tetratricopeptide repeat protein n=1 Tax=Niveibacterium sp. SC-1 TaxID=3135646 RepID=UPI00311F2356